VKVIVVSPNEDVAAAGSIQWAECVECVVTAELRSGELSTADLCRVLSENELRTAARWRWRVVNNSPAAVVRCWTSA
jgi:hypothetical protein